MEQSNTISSLSGCSKNNIELITHQDNNPTPCTSSKTQRNRSNSWPASWSTHVNRISKRARPDFNIPLVLDEGMQPAPCKSLSDCSIFNFHPKRIHQLHPKAFRHHQGPSTNTDNHLAPTVPPDRSLSLAGDILVDVQIERMIPQAEELTFSGEDSRPIAAVPGSKPNVAPIDQHLLTTDPLLFPSQNIQKSPRTTSAPPHKHSRSRTSIKLHPSTTHSATEPIPMNLATSMMRDVNRTHEGLALVFDHLLFPSMATQGRFSILYQKRVKY